MATITRLRQHAAGVLLVLPAVMVLAACVGTTEPPAANSGTTASVATSRTVLQVQEVFDRNAAAFTALYNRRARENSAIRDGRMVFSFGIDPDGSISHCELVSSTFDDPKFEASMLQRILLLKFGARDVPAFEVPHYPIDFHPM